MDYQKALETLEYRSGKTIKPNTYLMLKDDGSIVVRLYLTDIIRYYPDGRVRLGVRGHHTALSRDRINEYLEVGKMHVSKGVWICYYKGREYLFEEDMTLYPEGTCDATPYEVYEFNRIGERVKNMEDIKSLIEDSTIKALKTFWRRCHTCRRAIAYYASLEFLPLIIFEGTERDPWVSVVKERLAGV